MNRATTITPSTLPAFLVGIASSLPASRPLGIATDRALFEYHYVQWESETWYHSSLRRITENLHFKAIVSMGTRAVPFILEHLKRGEGTFLVYALNLIYGCCMTSEPLPITEIERLWIAELGG